MINQIWIMLALYVLGLGFIVLFYPKVSLSLCIMSALYWGALIYVISAVFLSFFGLYTRFIWPLLIAEILIIIIAVKKRQNVFKTVPWKKNIVWGIILLCLFSSVFLITKNRLILLTPDSNVYIAESLRIFNTDSIITPGAGLFFREVYGISEALMHSLASFISEPVLTLWHPYLWITLYGSFFAILYEFSHQKMMNKLASVVIVLLLTIWVGAAGLNWVNGYYIHVHLITAASIFFAFYFFGKMATSDHEEPIYGFLGALALCLFGLSRVESPIVIGLFLLLLMGAKTFSRKEVLVTFFPPILVEIVWLSHILSAYLGYESIFWSDSRIILALGGYLLLTLFIFLFLLSKKLQYLVKRYLTQIVFVLILDISLLLLISKLNHQTASLMAIIRQLFHVDIWGYFWWVNLLIVIFLLILDKTINKTFHFPKTMKLVGMMILVYILIILDLGYFRNSYVVRWTDSASRMFSHISPVISLYICKYIFCFFFNMKFVKKKVDCRDDHSPSF